VKLRRIAWDFMSPHFASRRPSELRLGPRSGRLAAQRQRLFAQATRQVDLVHPGHGLRTASIVPTRCWSLRPTVNEFASELGTASLA